MTDNRYGKLGIKYLEDFWSASLITRRGETSDRVGDWQADRLMLDALGLGLHQTMQYIYQNTPEFDVFEDWIIATAGKPEPLLVERINAVCSDRPAPHAVAKWLDRIDNAAPVLSDADLVCWQENGYVILREAVSEAERRSAENAIWEYIGADPETPDSWYGVTDHGIMLELVQHPALQANRRSERIHKAFAQLWGTPDLWVSADRCGFHAPQRADAVFPGPDLHWDIDFDEPLTFATQGLLYLTDTPAQQGALSLIPGFHHRIGEWLERLPHRADPNQQDLHSLGSVAVGGRAGDLLIWHQLLPHGASPNLGKQPRIVQYINMYPTPGIIDPCQPPYRPVTSASH